MLRDLLDKAGLSQRAAARELQIAERTMRYYAAGEVEVPRAVMLALEKLTEQDEIFFQALAARIRKEAGCTCGEFEISTYEGVSGGARSLAGLRAGHCKACSDGNTEDVAYRVLKIKRIPVIQPEAGWKVSSGRANK